MLNVSINFNACNSTNLNTNINSSNSNKNLNKKGDSKGTDVNVDKLHSTNTKRENNLNKQEKTEASSFEDVLDNLSEQEDESNLNEDISFLQAIMTLLEDNVEVNIEGNDIILDTSKLDFLISENSNLNEISDLNMFLESNNGWEVLEEEFELNLDADQDILLDFIKNCDNDLLTNFKMSENIEDKQELIMDAFEQFLLSQENSKLEDSYNAFKTNFKLATDGDINLRHSKIESLDSNDIIELLGNNTFKIDTNVNESMDNDLNNIIVRQELFTQDLEKSILLMKNNNLRQLKIKLSPKELGDMTIDISQLSETSNIKLTLSNPDTLDLVKSNLKEVIERLRENNIISDTSSVTIETETSNEQSFSSEFKEFSSGNKENKNSYSKDTLVDKEITTTSISEKTNTKDSVLDILA